MFNYSKNESGIILILALMIMSILLSMALGFGVFIISDLRQAQEIDSSIVSYYFADSGIERTLYLFRHGGKEKIGNFSGNGSNELLSSVDKNSDMTGDGSIDWTIEDSTDYEPTFFRQRLYNGQSVKLYFIGRSDSSNTAQSIKINWVKGFNSPKLQVVFTQLNPTDDGGTLVYFTDINKIEISDSIESANPVCFDFKDRNINGDISPIPSNYWVELKVLGTSGDYIDNLSVTAYNEKKGINGCNSEDYNNTYNPEGISNITIKSVGVFAGTRQAVYANIPPRDPSSSLFGFVLFSQEDITKGY